MTASDDEPKSHVRIGTERFPALPPDPDDPEQRPRFGWMCTAHQRHTGLMCRGQRMTAQRVCRKHGGRIPAAMAKAQERIDAAAKGLVEVLVDIATDPEESATARISAARELLNRSGEVRQPTTTVSGTVVVAPSPEYVAAVAEAKERAALAPEQRFAGKVFEITDIVDVEVVEDEWDLI